MRGHNGAPADSGGGGELCKSTSDMCEYDERNLNNTRDNEEDESNNNLRRGSDRSTAGRGERRLNPDARAFVPGSTRTRPGQVSQLDRGREARHRRLARRQRRTGQFRTNRPVDAGRSKRQRKAERRRLRRQEERLAQLQRGQDELRAAQHPGAQDIRTYMLRQPAPSTTRTDRRNSRRQEAQNIASSVRAAQAQVHDLMKNWTTDSYGRIDEKKPEGVIRLIWENTNSLKVITDPKLARVRCIDELRKRVQADILGLCETNCAWHVAGRDRQFHQLFGPGEDRMSRAACNKNDRWPPKSQYGGTALMAFGRLSGFSGGSGEDETKLGRWSWIRFKGDGKSVVMVSAYRPVKPSCVRRRGTDLHDHLGTVWEQHVRHFGDPDVDPRKRFDEDLLAELTRFRDVGDEIILMIDANQHIYDGKFGRALRSDLQMIDAYFRLYAASAPNSHHTGRNPIGGIFTSPGIDIEAVFVGRHGLGQGDHRLWVVDVTTHSCLGTDSPTPHRVQGRGLRVNKARTYNRELEKLCRRHKLSQKLDVIEELEEDIAARGEDDSLLILRADDLKDKVDREHRQLQLSAEKKCSKKKSGAVPFSDESDIWLKRRSTLRRLETFFLHGKDRRRASKSLRTSCSHHGLKQPHLWTHDEVMTELKVVRQRLERLKKEPKKRSDLLLRRYKRARSSGRADLANIIYQIMKAEEQRDRWIRPTWAFGKPRSLPASRVMVPSENGQSLIHSEQDSFETAVATNLESRFKTARDAPLRSSDQLHTDLGFRATTEAAQRILHGDYDFPSDIDESTLLLMQQIAELFARNDGNTIDVIITAEDFRYWKKAKEKTQSSRSGLHFGHYMAQAESDYLTNLQVRKLNLVMRRGVPLERWLHGLTVLLEKVAGKIDIDKLRAICLYEADFNWILKLIFSKRMMANARQQDLLQDEIFAVSGSGSVPAVVCGVIWTDIARNSNRSMAVNSVDLGQCFDAIDHSMASLSMQAFGVPSHIVNMGLEVLQTMKFWLRSAFGESSTPFGGSLEDPTMGLGQGSGWAPPGWSALSTAVMCAYRVKEFYTTIAVAWFNLLVTVAAMMFVDDMNQFLRAMEGMNDDDFIEFIQRALDLWGHLVLATGGYLKPSKCHVQFVLVAFRHGRPYYRQITLEQPFSIPQKDGQRADIECLDPAKSSRLLGFDADLFGSGKDHVDALFEKGMTWAARSNTAGYLTRGDRWLSLFHQLYPSMTYAIEALCAQPKWIEDKQHKIFYASLSRLGVNRNIIRLARTLPYEFGGLGLFDLVIETLGRRLHFLRQWWGTDTNVGRILYAGYEAFMKGHGLAGNVFSRNFKKLRPLSRPGFFRHTWELCHYYKVTFEILVDPMSQSSRLGDEPFMEKVLRIDPPMTSTDLQSINTVRRYKKVYMFSDIFSVDGFTVHPMMTSSLEGYSRGEFPTERPSSADFALWKVVLIALTSNRFVLPEPLPALVSIPHNHDGWFMTADRGRLVKRTQGQLFLQFVHSQERQLRRPIYSLLGDAPVHMEEDDLHFIASVSEYSERTRSARLHSAVPHPRPNQQHQPTVLDVLRSWRNPELWNDIEIDDDGWWIARALVEGTLMMISDGSYMEHRSRRHSSCGFRLVCRRTKKRAQCGWTDEHSRAGCYRGEILGAIGCLLLLKAGTSRLCARDDVDFPTLPLLRYLCDNKGVVYHGNDPDRKFSVKQSHIDLLLLLRWLVRDLPIRIKFEYVQSHMDDAIPYQSLSFEQQHNVDMDNLAKDVLKRGIRTGNVINSLLPFMYMLATDGKESIAGSPVTTLYHKEGDRTGRQLFAQKNILTDSQFTLVDWESFARTTTSQFPPTMRAWYTKHILGWNGVMTRLHLINPIKYPFPSCPCCSFPHEDKNHIILCQDEGRTKLYNDGVTKIDTWLRTQRTDPLLRSLIRRYLKGRSLVSMVSLLTQRSQAQYHRLALEHDDLGWINFIEGRISKQFGEIQLKYYASKSSGLFRKSARKWSAGLIERLIGLIHSQWLYRNSKIHYSSHFGGETVREYEDIMRSISQLVAGTDPDDLLPEDRQLMEVDFNQLAQANSSVRRTWASAMVAAKNVVRNLNGEPHSDDDSLRATRNSRRGGSSRRNTQSTRFRTRPTYQTQVQRRTGQRVSSSRRGQPCLDKFFPQQRASGHLDAEGSQRYKRRRKRG